jgi:hypothetical protein
LDRRVRRGWAVSSGTDFCVVSKSVLSKPDEVGLSNAAADESITIPRGFFSRLTVLLTGGRSIVSNMVIKKAAECVCRDSRKMSVRCLTPSRIATKCNREPVAVAPAIQINCWRRTPRLLSFERLGTSSRCWNVWSDRLAPTRDQRQLFYQCNTTPI